LLPVPGQPIGADYNQTGPRGNEVKGKFGNFCRARIKLKPRRHGDTEGRTNSVARNAMPE
jgi:hypothetical protein